MVNTKPFKSSSRALLLKPKFKDIFPIAVFLLDLPTTTAMEHLHRRKRVRLKDGADRSSSQCTSNPDTRALCWSKACQSLIKGTTFFWNMDTSTRCSAHPRRQKRKNHRLFLCQVSRSTEYMAEHWDDSHMTIVQDSKAVYSQKTSGTDDVRVKCALTTGQKKEAGPVPELKWQQQTRQSQNSPGSETPKSPWFSIIVF